MFDVRDRFTWTILASILGLTVAAAPVGLKSASAQSVPTEGLQLWLQADAVGQASGGTAVIKWPDKSPQDHSLYQHDEAHRPTYVGDAINGKPLIKFEANDRFEPGEVHEILTPGTFYTIFRVTRQDDRGYLSVAEGTVKNGAKKSALQRSLQGQLAELLVYGRRLSKAEKERLSSVLGHRYGLRAGSTVARSDEASESAKEEMKVHGAWTITVRSKNGDLVERRQFENDVIGEDVPARLMAGTWIVGKRSVRLGGPDPPCLDSSNNSAPCASVDTSSQTQRNEFATLTREVPSSGTDSGNLVLNGSVTAQQDGGIRSVWTSIYSCLDENATGPGECGGNFDNSSRFTQKYLTPDVFVDKNQQVAVEVVVDFSDSS